MKLNKTDIWFLFEPWILANFKVFYFKIGLISTETLALLSRGLFALKLKNSRNFSGHKLNPISHGGRWIPPPLKEKFNYSIMVHDKVPKVLDFS